MKYYHKKDNKRNYNLFFLLMTLLLSSNLNAQVITTVGPQYPPAVYPCGETDNPNVTLAALGGFGEVTPNGDGTVTQCFDLQSVYGIDPTTVTDSIIVSVFYDLGFNSAVFSTSNGYTVAGITNPQQGTVNDHFAYAILPNDGSGQICATVDVDNDHIEDIAFFATISHGTYPGGIVSTGFIDNEIVINDDPNDVGECEVGILPIGSNGTADDVMDVNIDFTISEVIEGDPRTITVTFEACGVTYNQSIDPEPVPNVPGVAVISVTLPDVPGNCTELSYSLCSLEGEQSYGIGGISITSDCFFFPDLTLNKEVSTSTAALGDTIIYTITVLNEGLAAATGVEVTEVLPIGLIYLNDDGAGTYDNLTGLWSIGNVAIGESTILNIEAIIDAEGVIVNEAEITAMNEDDTDSTPDNNNTNEDDMANVCVSVPIQVCDNEAISVDLIAPDGMPTYQWYLDGVAIASGTNQTYTATAAGTYTYTVDGAGPTGDCIGELCCPVVVELIECCEPIQCIPVILNKL